MSFNFGLRQPHDKWVSSLCGNKHNISQFLFRYKICTNCKCHVCNQPQSIQLLKNKRDLDKNTLPYRWVCGDCGTDSNFLKSSYLFKSKLPLSDHIGLLYKFYLKRNAKEAAKELNIGHTTAKLWFSFYRECIHDYMQKDFYPNFKFNARFATEWDEAKLCKKFKHHTGTYKDGDWVVGGIQRETKYICLTRVEKRTAEILHSYITKHSESDSTHITDGWKGYLGLDKLGRYHYNNSHKDGFVHPLTGKHTNNIENVWSLVRGDLAKFRGVRGAKLQIFLDVFAFRRNMQLTDEGVWCKLLLVIAKKQHVTTRPKFN